MPVECCETHSLVKCPSVLILVYIELTVQDRVVLSYICSVLHHHNNDNNDNDNNNTGLEVSLPDPNRRRNGTP